MPSESDRAQARTATECLDPGGAKGDLAPPRGLRAGAHDLARLAATELDHEPCHQLHAGPCEGRIDPALEAIAGVALQVEGAPCCGGADGIEERDLDEDVRRFHRASRGLAAHHAGETDDAALVADPGHAVVEHVLLAVERGELGTALAEAEPDVTLHLAGIEDVHGAVAVDGQEVGEVDQSGDRAQADRGEPLLEPARALAVSHAPDVATEKERARTRPITGEVQYHVDGARERAGNGLNPGRS